MTPTTDPPKIARPRANLEFAAYALLLAWAAIAGAMAVWKMQARNNITPIHGTEWP